MPLDLRAHAPGDAQHRLVEVHPDHAPTTCLSIGHRACHDAGAARDVEHGATWCDLGQIDETRRPLREQRWHELRFVQLCGHGGDPEGLLRRRHRLILPREVYDPVVERRHDATSGSPAGASGGTMPFARASGGLALESSAEAPGFDPLSDVLRAVRLTGTVFFQVDASSPWVIEMPDSSVLASVTLPRAQHVISYHVVTRGSCWGTLMDSPPVRLEAGDVLLFPHGDAYAMSISAETRGGPSSAEVLEFMGAMAEGRLPVVVEEGGGGPERLGLVCGFLGCDARPFNPLLAALPRLLHVRQAFAPGDPLAQLIEFALVESQERRAGSECVRLRLSEVMFVEVVRRYLAGLPAEQTGWLAGLRDRTVSRA